MSYPKQVIVVRKDLNMSSGKTAAQVAHASMGVFFDWMKMNSNDTTIESEHFFREYILRISNITPQFEWIENSFTKVVVGVSSLEELMTLDKTVRDKGLLSCLITDNGLTEFKCPTVTCLAIGPLYSEEIDELTSHLKLLKDDFKEEAQSYLKLLRQLNTEINRLKKQDADVSSLVSILANYQTKKDIKF